MIDKDKLENEFINLCNDKYFDELVKFVKWNKNNIDIDTGFTWACSHNHIKVAKYLLKEHDANINAKNNYAIRWVCTREYNDLTKYLLFSDELKEHASVKAAFSISIEYNKDILEYLILETDKQTRAIIQEVINETPNASHYRYPQELLNKMSLVDSLKEELPNKSETSKKIKI